MPITCALEPRIPRVHSDSEARAGMALDQVTNFTWRDSSRMSVKHSHPVLILLSPSRQLSERLSLSSHIEQLDLSSQAWPNSHFLPIRLEHPESRAAAPGTVWL